MTGWQMRRQSGMMAFLSLLRLCDAADIVRLGLLDLRHR
ncbi:MAG: hypothetical protein OJF58_004689 [Enhydrobacter sp.]|nr:MAG: hypothetical protein OJF58_004689 [Enhydrobacter sp.]